MSASGPLPPEVRDLLSTLARRGIAVGIREWLCAKHLWVQSQGFVTAEGRTDREQLLGAFAALLVKSQAEREVFDAVAGAWRRRVERVEAAAVAVAAIGGKQGPQAGDGASERSVPPPPTASGATAQAPRQRRPWGVVLTAVTAAVVAVGAVVAFYRSNRPEPPGAPGAGAAIHEVETPPPLSPPVETKRPQVVISVPVLQAQAIDHSTPWRPWTLAGASLLLLGGLAVAARRRSLLPPSAPLPRRDAEGPRRVVAATPPRGGSLLLDTGDEETLLWGAGQHLSDEPTHRLDVVTSVRATAESAGIVRLRFHNARIDRGIWLWCDAQTSDPELWRLADEIQGALEHAGLPVERASFRGVPAELHGSDGAPLQPSDLHERQRSARVAVLTDGRVLRHGSRSAINGPRVRALLHALAEWEHLVWIDFGRGTGDLQALLDEELPGVHTGMAVVPPERAIETLVGGERKGAAAKAELRPEGRDFFLWKAACALAPSAFTEEAALRLRREFQLRSRRGGSLRFAARGTAAGQVPWSGRGACASGRCARSRR